MRGALLEMLDVSADHARLGLRASTLSNESSCSGDGIVAIAVRMRREGPSTRILGCWKLETMGGGGPRLKKVLVPAGAKTCRCGWSATFIERHLFACPSTWRRYRYCLVEMTRLLSSWRPAPVSYQEAHGTALHFVVIVLAKASGAIGPVLATGDE